jgi:hypothetical protein
MCQIGTWAPGARIATHFPDHKSHTRALLSYAAVSSVRALLLSAAVSNPSECPVQQSTATLRRTPKSYTRTVPTVHLHRR